MEKEVDVVIVGGALTGSVLALALSSQTQHKIRIAIVEKQQTNYQTQGGFDARSIALAHGSLQKMATIQPLIGENLQTLIERLATPIKQILVSDQGHFGKVCLSANELKLSQLGAVVELAPLGEALAQRLAQQPNIQLFCPDSIATLTRSPQHCQMTLTSGTKLRCSLLVAADGIHSPLAKLCGVASQTVQDYQQSAIIANVQISEAHHHQAFERFTPEGPLALLPLRGKQMSLVWCMKSPEEKMAYSEQAFLQALQQQFGWKLGKFLHLSQRFVYPLILQKSESHIHHRLAIVGNAAQQLHPVAGQGFNLGLRDLFCLAQQVGMAFRQRQDIGDYRLLTTFEKQRQEDQQRMMQQTSGLIHIFGSECLTLQAGRNLALMGLSHCTTLRQWIAQQALGY